MTETTSAPIDTGAPPPEPGYEPDPAPPPEPSGQDQQSQDPRVVPYQALREAREETRREREQRLAGERETAQRLAVIEARSQEWLRSQQQQAEPDIPPFDQDPAAHLRAVNERNTRLLQQYGQKISAYEAQQQQSAQEQAMIGWAQAQEVQFAAQHQDYPAAVQHVTAARMQELQAMGVPPQSWRNVIHNEHLAIIQGAQLQGRNPAEVMYQLAAYRGYRPQGQQSQQQRQGPDPATAALRREAAASINAIPGSSPPAGGAKALLSMSREEFEKATNDPAKFRKMMGG